MNDRVVPPRIQITTFDVFFCKFITRNVQITEEHTQLNMRKMSRNSKNIRNKLCDIMPSTDM